MSKYVNEQVAREAHKNGVKIGGVEPCAEAKWTGWAVFSHGSEIIACVVDMNGRVLCGESIKESELPLYVDDAKDALGKLYVATGESQ